MDAEAGVEPQGVRHGGGEGGSRGGSGAREGCRAVLLSGEHSDALGILGEASREGEAGSLVEEGQEEAGRGEAPEGEMGFCKEAGQFKPFIVGRPGTQGGSPHGHVLCSLQRKVFG